MKINQNSDLTNLNHVFFFSLKYMFTIGKMVKTYLIEEKKKIKKERYLIGQDSTIYKFSIKLSFSDIGQN